MYNRIGLVDETVPTTCEEAKEYTYFSELNQYCGIEKIDNLKDLIKACDSLKWKQNCKLYSETFSKLKNAIQKLRINCEFVLRRICHG